MARLIKVLHGPCLVCHDQVVCSIIKIYEIDTAIGYRIVQAYLAVVGSLWPQAGVAAQPAGPYRSLKVGALKAELTLAVARNVLSTA